MTEMNAVEPALAAALEKRGYVDLTPVQKAMLDPAFSGRDLLVSAQTGSGKTVAFGLALAPGLLEGKTRFDRASAPLALVIAPTRELAMQVARELQWLYADAAAHIATCVGGMDMRNERRALERGAHIVVGTPGRLRDHITRRSLVLDDIRAVVLDEADEMLDLGFREDLEFILESSPDERRTLMFSATVSKDIAKLAESYQRNAERISVTSEQKQHADIEYRALVMAPSDRDNAIVNVLRYYEAPNAIVFCNTRAAVNHLTARLHNRGFTVVALSGELSQNERSHALQAMRDGRARVCIATDVAARGIDLPNLELVIHADLPTNPETLLHRSGRTGRAGRKGVSALIVPTNVRRKAERILQAGSLKAQWAAPPSVDEVNAKDDERLAVDPLLKDAVGEDEREAVSALLRDHGPEQLAVAFLRLYRAGRSAPEDLIDIGTVFDGADRRPRARTEFSREDRDSAGAERGRRGESFGPSRWISLSVGRKQNAEPRWLIPLLCKAGHLTKSDIGAIKMQQEETFVEIAEDSFDNFMHAVGPNKTMERGMRVRVIEGTPDMSRPARGPRNDKPARGDWKPARKFEEHGDARPYRDREQKPARKDGDFDGQRRPKAARAENAGGERDFSKRSAKPSDKTFDKPSKTSARPDRDPTSKRKKSKSNAR